MKRSMLKFWAAAALAITLVACEQATDLLEDVFTGEVETVSEADLPGEVLEEINQSFPDATIQEVVKVVGSNGAEVYGITFEDGRQVTIRARGGMCEEIAIENLPQGISDYITANYPDELITKAVSMEHDSMTVYLVRISSGEVLAFDEAGDFLAIKDRRGRHRKHGEVITTDQLPEAAQNYLSDNYEASSVRKAIQITGPDETVIFLVKLDTGERLAFDADGNYLDDFQAGWDK